MSNITKDQWHRERATVALRNVTFPRRWGMRVTVYDDGGNSGDYVLSYGLSSTNKNDNANWLKVANQGSTWGGGGGVTTASNGLNVVGTDVRMGGPLIQNTVITTNGLYSWSMGTGLASITFTTGGNFQHSSLGGQFTVEATTGDVSISTGILYVGATSGAFTNSKAHFEATINSYSQVNSINKSGGTSASTDFIVTADTGTDAINYGDFGINSSTYNDPSFTISGPLDTYLYSNGGDLVLGTITPAMDIVFHSAGSLQANFAGRVTAAGRWYLGYGSASFAVVPSAKLTVRGESTAAGLAFLVTSSVPLNQFSISDNGSLNSTARTGSTGQTFNNAWTAAGNNAAGFSQVGTLTARATASDTISATLNTTTLVAAAATQTLIGYNLSPTWTPGAFTPTTTGYYYNGTTSTGQHNAWQHDRGNIRWNSTVTPAVLAASQNNYNPAGLNEATIAALSASAGVSITGIAGGANGMVMPMFNSSAFNITLTNQDALSTAANRFAMPANYVLGPNNMALAIYDGTASRWRLLGSIFNSAPTGELMLSDGINAVSSNILVSTGSNITTLRANTGNAMNISGAANQHAILTGGASLVGLAGDAYVRGGLAGGGTWGNISFNHKLNPFSAPINFRSGEGIIHVAQRTVDPVSAPSAGSDNGFFMYSKTTSVAGDNNTLAIWAQAPVEVIGAFIASHKMRIWYNNVEYWIQLDAV